MTSKTRTAALGSRWAGLLLAAFTAVLAFVLPAGTASASGVPAAQTRVGAIHPTVTAVVGVAEQIAAGQRRCRAPSQLRHVSATGVAAEAAGGGGNVVYRGLAEGEDAAAGLTARAPGADVSPMSHVAGKGASPWISTSKSLDVATSKYGKFGVVGIDLSKVGGEVVDVSGGFPGVPGMLSN